MEKKGWKITAIIFISLFIITTSIFSLLIGIGLHTLNQESECRTNICGSDQYDSFYYNDVENICYCYTAGEMTHQKYMK